MRALFGGSNPAAVMYTKGDFITKNPVTTQLMVNAFHVVTRQTWHIGWASRRNESDRLSAVDCHERIAAAIDARDALSAEAAMAEHYDGSVKALLSAGVI